MQLQLNCADERIKMMLRAYYSAEGELLYQDSEGKFETVIPGTYGAEYHRLFCLGSK